MTGNVDLSTHLVPGWETNCYDDIVARPAGFQLNAATSSGTFQEEFQEAVLGFTADWWPPESVFSEACLGDLVGFETLAEARAGKRGPVLSALESAENGQLVGQCANPYQPPEITDPNGDVLLLGIIPCEPFCVEVGLYNPSERDAADVQEAEFLLESFVVQCLGLPQSIEPGETVRCRIKHYVTEGFQLLQLYRFSGGARTWGFEYPIHD